MSDGTVKLARSSSVEVDMILGFNKLCEQGRRMSKVVSGTRVVGGIPS